VERAAEARAAAAREVERAGVKAGGAKAEARVVGGAVARARGAEVEAAWAAEELAEARAAAAGAREVGVAAMAAVATVAATAGKEDWVVQEEGWVGLAAVAAAVGSTVALAAAWVVLAAVAEVRAAVVMAARTRPRVCPRPGRSECKGVALSQRDRRRSRFPSLGCREGAQRLGAPRGWTAVAREVVVALAAEGEAEEVAAREASETREVVAALAVAVEASEAEEGVRVGAVAVGRTCELSRRRRRWGSWF
jgi:hypothetical protein